MLKSPIQFLCTDWRHIGKIYIKCISTVLFHHVPVCRLLNIRRFKIILNDAIQDLFHIQIGGKIWVLVLVVDL